MFLSAYLKGLIFEKINKRPFEGVGKYWGW